MSNHPGSAETVVTRIDRRQVLITFHGTIVQFDTSSGCLRHGAIADHEPNVFMTQEGAGALLWWQGSDEPLPLGDFAPRLCTLADDHRPNRLKVAAVGGGLVALCADGRFLCAEAGGAITCSRLKASLWESFLLVSLEDLEHLKFILAQSWLSRFDGLPIATSEIRCRDGHMIAFGRRHFLIRDVLAAARAAAAADGSPRRLSIGYDGWKLEDYVLYRPLAYLVAYGKPEIFSCAAIAIQSLFEFGAWEGDVLLITDANNAGFAERLPPALRHRILTAVIPAHDVLDYTLARYKLGAVSASRFYQPVVYLDTDIVCDAPLRDIARAAALSPDLQACPEGLLFDDGDYYGRSLLKLEAATFKPEERGYSSGVFAFRHVDEQRELFGLIVDTAYAFSVAAGARDRFQFFDQPFFNYVLYKTRQPAASILGARVEIQLSHDPAPAAPVGKGLVHFAGGVGNAVPKLTLMTDYLELLRRARTRDDPAYGSDTTGANADAPTISRKR
jgi:hypothetical protein